MKISFAKDILIPENPFYLLGYVGETREKPAVGILDLPEIIIMAIENEGNIFLMVSFDVVTFSKDKSDILKNLLVSKYDLDYNNISFIATHTHSGPNGTSTRVGIDENIKYFTKFKESLIKLTKEVLDKLEECEVFYLEQEIEGYFSNRNNINAPYDNKINLIKFYNKENSLIGGLLNLPCHSTVLGPNNPYSSTDLLGNIRKKMAKDLDTIIIGTMGAAGDISNRQYRKGDDPYELNRTVNGIYNQIPNKKGSRIESLSPVKINIIKHEINYDNSVYFDEYREEIKVTKKKLENKDILPVDFKLKSTIVSKLERKLEINKVEKVVNAKIYSFGELEIILFGGELSTKFGMQIKNYNTDKNTIIITCVDDHAGYFIEKEEYGKYYETIANDNPKGEPEKIVERIIKLL